MTQQFHAGQEVEILDINAAAHIHWRSAKVIRELLDGAAWEVQLPDGERVAFKPEHIRSVDSPERAAAKQVAHDFGEALMGRRS